MWQGDTPAFTPGQSGVCQLDDNPVNSETPLLTTLLGIDPGKKSIVTTSEGSKFSDEQGTVQWHTASTATTGRTSEDVE
jgi:hypothetical protein